jgi:hypothetical protein
MHASSAVKTCRSGKLLHDCVPGWMNDVSSSSLLHVIEAVCSVGAPANGTVCMMLNSDGVRFRCVSGCKGYGCDILILGNGLLTTRVHVLLASLLEIKQHLTRDHRVSICLLDDASRLHVRQDGIRLSTDIELATVDIDGGGPELVSCGAAHVCLKPEKLKSAMQRLACVDKSVVRFSSGPCGFVLGSMNVDGTGGKVHLDTSSGATWELSIRLDRHRLSLLRWCARSSILSLGMLDMCVEFRAVSKCGTSSRLVFFGIEPEDVCT